MGETTKTELASLVKSAVGEALRARWPAGGGQTLDLECPDCQAKFEKVPAYLDHRVNEYVGKSLEELKGTIDALKVPTSDEFLAECKDGLCALVEETYDIRKKGEAAPPEEEAHLFSHHDAEEEVPG